MKRRTWLMLALALLPLTSCKDMRRAAGLADAAIADFHRQFNEQKFKDIYAAGHADLKSSTTEDDFVKLLEAVHRKLGKQVKSAGAGWRINSNNGKTTIGKTQETTFEQGKGTESFTFVVSGESCALQSYHIESKDMMLK